MTLTKENLIEYAKEMHIEVDENDTYENVTKQSYNEYLKQQKDIKKSKHRVKYEQIPQ